MTSSKFSVYLTPSPCQNLEITQPPFLSSEIHVLPFLPRGGRCPVAAVRALLAAAAVLLVMFLVVTVTCGALFRLDRRAQLLEERLFLAARRR